MNPFQLDHPISKQLMAGGSALLALSLLVDFKALPLSLLSSKKPTEDACQTIVRAETKISHEQLAKVMVLAVSSKKQQVRDILKEPYCKLADLQIRAGATAQREAYPVDFDPQARLIVLYEGDEYGGFRFDLHQ